ncbi:MAG: recombinase family protein [Agathobaculum sp.]|uniref:recombinase family protein n=1 Tax=Agathobaculum sp. TaxID=2048138 RepID=UPI0025C2C093|nr:recombinase family protein [Agathobaculum sp.]MCI7125810.1 recombinase family protein [Agathobaculum sp.]MDY3711416.1 recombinase family protein [Agathobaculum sp.]
MARLRVAAYCRVSTDQDDQLHSLAAQKQFFQAYIDAHPTWTLAGIWADEGVSGTSTRKRVQFRALLAAAERGELDLVLTKEVSRFARNTMDALGYTRQLAAWGVGVLFLNDNIDTRAGEGEFRLTIMASVAQEESRKTSERVKWGQRRSMERGVVFGADTLFGYRLRGGVLTVRPAQAAVVQRVYRLFLDEGKGTHVIARELTESGVPTPRAKSGIWSSTMVLRMLRNEKYCGDLLQKKTCTPDFLTHRSVPNRGQEPAIYLRGHHEAIVSRARFEQAQRELARRGAGKTRHSARYWCSGRIRCGVCGRALLPRRAVRKDGSTRLRWSCRNCGGAAAQDAWLRACVRRTLDAALPDRGRFVRGLCADWRAAERLCGQPPAARADWIARQDWLLAQLLEAEQVYAEAVSGITVTGACVEVALRGGARMTFSPPE